MSSSLALRQSRHLSTTASAVISAAATTTTTTNNPISISKAKTKLRAEHDPDKAIEIYSSVSDVYISPLSSRYAQEYAVKRLVKSRRFSDIEKFLEGHKNNPKIKLEPFLSSIIRSYGVAGMFDNALKTYDQMDDLGTPRSTISFNALLTAYTRNKVFDRVPELFDELPKKHSFAPDKVSYGILIKSYCEMGNVELAMEKLKEMKEKGVEITSITYTTILHSLYKKGMDEEAGNIWNEMVKNECADVGAYNVRIMNIHGGEVEGVKALIEEMYYAELTPDTISYNYLMTCYCRKDMMDEAKKVYDDLEKLKCKPNAATYRTLIFYLCKNGRFETGYKIFKESVANKKIPDFNTLKFLVEGLAKKSKIKEAKGMIRTMKKKFPPNLLKAWEKLQNELGLTIASDDNTNDEIDDAKSASA